MQRYAHLADIQHHLVTKLDLYQTTVLKFCCAVQDHYFDVVTNVVGLVAAVLGDKYLWWIDPVGAVLLAVYTIVNWFKTVLENAGTFQSSLC
jgi:divalent metal cation (Fe/Co/Zn/Cd) transporter